jgi:hypothetical protein
MNTDRSDCQPISRRVALTATALALGAAAVAAAVLQAAARISFSLPGRKRNRARVCRRGSLAMEFAMIQSKLWHIV